MDTSNLNPLNTMDTNPVFKISFRYNPSFKTRTRTLSRYNVTKKRKNKAKTALTSNTCNLCI